MSDSTSSNNNKPTHRFPRIQGNRTLVWMSAISLYAVLLLVSSASAADPVNWTELTSVIDGFVSIVPSFGTMIGAIMPILMTIAVYVFVLKFWDKLLGAIDSAFGMFK